MNLSNCRQIIGLRFSIEQVKTLNEKLTYFIKLTTILNITQYKQIRVSIGQSPEITLVSGPRTN